MTEQLVADKEWEYSTTGAWNYPSTGMCIKLAPLFGIYSGGQGFFPFVYSG